MIIIGHRGAKGLAPQNTIASLQKALEHTVDEIEFDVRVTKDKKVVLAHDPDVHDQSGNAVSIRDNTLAELQAHKTDLPELHEALAALPPSMPIVVEIKPGEPAAPICDELSFGLKKGRLATATAVASFDYEILKAVQKRMPQLPLVINDRWSGVRASSRARRLGAKRITMNKTWLWSGFIRAMANGGYQLSTYTLNDAEKARRWEEAGLYGVVTDYPDRY